MKVRDFYTRVMGLTVTDENPERGICFLSADPENEHHELALSQARGADHPEGARPATENVGQISYIVPDMAALGELNRRFKEEKSISCVPSPTVSPAASTSTTQRTTWDEVYFKTGFVVKQGFGRTIDLETQTDQEILDFSQSFEASEGPFQGAQLPVGGDD